jgi:phosphoribosylaminoimidazole (AIR) synthetase
MAHITGGGLIDNVPRMLPDGLAAEFDPTTWQVNPVFRFLVREGRIAPGEQYRVFNMGIGFVLAIAPERVNEALAALPRAVVIGRVIAAGDERLPRVRGLTESTDGNVDA